MGQILKIGTMKIGLVLAFIALGFTGWSQERIVFEAEQVSIIPPEGFVEVEFFTGIFNYSNGASIQLEAVDSIAYVLLAEGYTKENLEPQGVTLVSKENVVINGMKGVLITMTFEVTQPNEQTGGEETRVYERLNLVTGDMNRTIFLSANYALIVKDLVYDAIRESLFSARFEK